MYIRPSVVGRIGEQTMKERIKKAIKIAFATGMIIGSIAGSLIGYSVGAGKLHIELPEHTESCYAVQCDCIDVWGKPVSYTKAWHCGVHEHECEYAQ